MQLREMTMHRTTFNHSKEQLEIKIDWKIIDILQPIWIAIPKISLYRWTSWNIRYNLMQLHFLCTQFTISSTTCVCRVLNKCISPCVFVCVYDSSFCCMSLRMFDCMVHSTFIASNNKEKSTKISKLGYLSQKGFAKSESFAATSKILVCRY